MIGNFDTLIAEMESNNLALEALLADMSADESQMDPATEGLFSKPKTLDEMLANVKKTIDKKCKTSEDCEDWLAKIKGEEEKFNTAIKNLQEATKKYQEDGDKKALKATCKPILKNLKKTCNVLSMKDISEDASNITEDELKKLRDFLVGAKKIISDKAAELRDCGCGDGEGAEEGCGSSCESFLAMLQDNTPDVAMESAVQAATDKVRMALASLCKSLATKCKQWSQKALSKGNKKGADRFAALQQWFTDRIANLNRKMSPEAAQKWKDNINKKRQEAEDLSKEVFSGDVVDKDGNPVTESFDQIDLEISDCDLAVESAFDELSSTMEVAIENYTGEVATEGLAATSVIAGYSIGVIIAAIAAGIAKANDPDDKQRKNIQLGQISKQITATIKDAKKAARNKDYDQAIALYNKAIKGYQGLLSMAKKIPDRTVSGGKYADGSDTVKSVSKVQAINWCNSKISGCQAAIQKIKDKKSKADDKAAKKAAKAANKAGSATEGYTDVDDALESLLTELNEPAMESFDDEDPLAGLDEALSEE